MCVYVAVSYFLGSPAQPSIDLILDPLQPFPLTPRSHVKVPGGSRFLCNTWSGLPKKPSYVYEHAVIQQLVVDPVGSTRFCSCVNVFFASKFPRSLLLVPSAFL